LSACSSSEEEETTETNSEELLLDSLFCEGKATLAFEPGITTTQQTVTITSDTLLGTASPDVGACVVVGAAISGGTRHSEREHSSSCSQVLDAGAAALDDDLSVEQQ
jgi:hypothetical protein